MVTYNADKMSFARTWPNRGMVPTNKWAGRAARLRHGLAALAMIAAPAGALLKRKLKPGVAASALRSISNAGAITSEPIPSPAKNGDVECVIGRHGISPQRRDSRAHHEYGSYEMNMVPTKDSLQSW